MTTVPLYGGPLKRTLIRRAFGLCGQSVTEFELTPEELSLGLQCANSLASTLGASFPWNSPAYGDGSAEDESGIAPDDVQGFIGMLASEIGPNIGRAYAPNGIQARAISSLRAKYNPVPFMELGRGTPRGAGNRIWQGWPYFTTDISSDEPNQ